MTVKRAAAIVGIGQTNWRQDYQRVKAGECPTDSYGYGAQAFVGALKDANLQRKDIDGLIVGPTTANERMGEVLGLDVRWGGQADAVQAVMQAVMAIETGMAEVVALVYGNDQRSAGTQYGGPEAMGAASFLSYVYHAPWGFTSQGALYAMMFRAYQHERGFTERQLGEVAVAQRAWSSLNPDAVMQERVTIDDYLNSRYVCEPLHLLDYCLINDGGVALIVAEASRAKKISKNPIYIEALGRSDINKGATVLEPRLTNFYLPAQQQCAEQVFNAAGLGPKDMNVAQIYDSFSLHVPLALEGYGYCAVGEAGKFLTEQGIGPGGALAVNTSGGHLSDSYMQGWNHQIESIKQLRGTAGKRQVDDCRFVHYSSDVAGKAMSIIYGR
jgi:acetyl-CoA acetyltransferase